MTGLLANEKQRKPPVPVSEPPAVPHSTPDPEPTGPEERDPSPGKPARREPPDNQPKSACVLGGNMPLSWFCPVDCSACWDSACVAEGCKRSSASVLAACDDCGTLFLAGGTLVCSDCAPGAGGDPEHTPGTRNVLDARDRTR